jgi:histidine triad (HIT) family protein
VVPKKVIQRVGDIVEADAPIIGHLLVVAAQMAKKLNLDRGFRIVINSGPDACESVPHLHVHVLAKRQMSWPPG